MKQRAKTHLLPTDRQTSIVINNSIGDKQLQFRPDLIGSSKMVRSALTFYNLYITTDEEPKTDDWVIETANGNVVVQFDEMSLNQRSMGCRKIIATTDPELVINISRPLGVVQELPQPSQSFIEHYCKVDGLDEVDVEYESNINRGEKYSKDSKLQTGDVICNPIYIPKLDSNNCIITHSIKDSYTREEVIHIMGQLFDQLSANRVFTQGAFDEYVEELL